MLTAGIPGRNVVAKIEDNEDDDVERVIHRGFNNYFSVV
jgi:hypothetical protein